MTTQTLKFNPPTPPYGTTDPSRVDLRHGFNDHRCRTCLHFQSRTQGDGEHDRCGVVCGPVHEEWVCKRWTDNLSVAETRKHERALWAEQESARSWDILYGLRDRFRGQRIFVLGTGPSLDQVTKDQWDRLREEYTFGVNMLLAYEPLPFTPDFYCVSESSWLQGVTIQALIERFKRLPASRFYAHHWPLPDLNEWTWVPLDSSLELEKGQVCFHPPVVGLGGSVVTMAAELALWMGFGEIYLLGCDATTRGHAQGLDCDRKDGYRDPQDTFIRSMCQIEEWCRNHERRIVDLTPGGRLRIKRGELGGILYAA